MFDVGLIQLREWLRSGRVKDGADDWVPEVGDVVVVGCVMRPWFPTYVRVRAEMFEGQHEFDQLVEEFERKGYEIWRVVDDSGRCDFYGYRTCEWCGRWVLSTELYGEIVESLDGCGYSVVCCDERSCEEFKTRKEQLKTLVALRQLREAGEIPDSPIHYDVMWYNSHSGKFQCVGSNLRYSVAHDMVRRYERGGSVAFMCESVTCHG